MKSIPTAAARQRCQGESLFTHIGTLVKCRVNLQTSGTRTVDVYADGIRATLAFNSTEERKCRAEHLKDATLPSAAA